MVETRKDYDVIVFGATGFTGKLCVRYLLEEQLLGLDESFDASGSAISPEKVSLDERVYKYGLGLKNFRDGPASGFRWAVCGRSRHRLQKTLLSVENQLDDLTEEMNEALDASGSDARTNTILPELLV